VKQRIYEEKKTQGSFEKNQNIPGREMGRVPVGTLRVKQKDAQESADLDAFHAHERNLHVAAKLKEVPGKKPLTALQQNHLGAS